MTTDKDTTQKSAVDATVSPPNTVPLSLRPQQSRQPVPELTAMSEQTQRIHSGIDAAIRTNKVPYLHSLGPTVQMDMIGSDTVIEWQEKKQESLFLGETCWAELPPLYARYGTADSQKLTALVKQWESAKAAIVTDCGMQAIAIVFDCFVEKDSHSIVFGQVYNKTLAYLRRLHQLVGGDVTVVDNGDYQALHSSVRASTRLVFAECFTNPHLRAHDPKRLSALGVDNPQLSVIVDTTIATPMAFAQPLLSNPGIAVVVASGTKALGGEDRDMWGYAATHSVDTANRCMDLLAMRGGILDWRRAHAIVNHWETAVKDASRRETSARKLAEFLHNHPLVSTVWHPSLHSHPDSSVVAQHYEATGSLLSFTIQGATDDEARHMADVVCMTGIVRYALSFDGVVTKVNHHKTVSEYFTTKDQAEQLGYLGLIRVGVGLEDAGDLLAVFDWALRNANKITQQELKAWQQKRRADLGLRLP